MLYKISLKFTFYVANRWVQHKLEKLLTQALTSSDFDLMRFNTKKLVDGDALTSSKNSHSGKFPGRYGIRSPPLLGESDLA